MSSSPDNIKESISTEKLPDGAPDSSTRRDANGLLDPAMMQRACLEAFVKLDPRLMWHNPVMCVVEVGTVLTLGVAVWRLTQAQPSVYAFGVGVVLLLTLLFANFAEAFAEARGKAQAGTLRQARADTPARKRLANAEIEMVSSTALRRGDVVLVSAGEMIPGDGEVIEGMATVDESAITGESAPVVREAGTDFSGVTGGTRVLSDQLAIRITSDPGETFLDKMIALVEGASRQKTPNEIALSILLAALTLVFLIVVVTLPAIASSQGVELDIVTLIALLVCLIPTTIGGLLPAIGIAGMDRALRANVLAKSGKAVEVAGDIDVLLLDKTGTITFGNRQATMFWPVAGVDSLDLARAASLCSLADQTPEGKSIVRLATQKGVEPQPERTEGAEFIEFSAQTRMSGIDLLEGLSLRKGASDRMKTYATQAHGAVPADLDELVDRVASRGATPLVVTQDGHVFGVIELSDVIKPGLRERFDRMRQMGLKTIMVTGDNPLTAAAIAAQAGVDDFIAEAKPEDKLELIRVEQRKGKLVAMMGDGTNDAPALAQADVGLAMNSGTQAAKEAGNMIDLDSDPTKLLEVVEVGKQLLITRGALTTFSISNDVAKYFAIIPALFVLAFPQMATLDVMGLGSPRSAIMSAVLFNALVIPALVPLAIRGVVYRPGSANSMLRRNLLVYGLGGLIAPFVGIKLLDMLLAVMGLH